MTNFFLKPLSNIPIALVDNRILQVTKDECPLLDNDDFLRSDSSRELIDFVNDLDTDNVDIPFFERSD